MTDLAPRARLVPSEVVSSKDRILLEDSVQVLREKTVTRHTMASNLRRGDLTWSGIRRLRSTLMPRNSMISTTGKTQSPDPCRNARSLMKLAHQWEKTIQNNGQWFPGRLHQSLPRTINIPHRSVRLDTHQIHENSTSKATTGQIAELCHNECRTTDSHRRQ